MARKYKTPWRAVTIQRKSYEPIVQNGLAITPAEMEDMRKRGMAISAQNAQLLQVADAGDTDFFVPLEHQRGFDLADGWNAARDIRHKVHEMRDKAVAGQIPLLDNGLTSNTPSDGTD